MAQLNVSRRFHGEPVLALRPYIERFWGWEESALLRFPLIAPGLGAELFFHHGRPLRVASASGDVPLERAHLLCTRRAALQLLPQSGLGFTAVRIRAGALGRFTRVPLKELNDTQLGASELWGRAGSELAERVAHAPGSDERVRLLEAFLLERLAEGAADVLAERAVQLIYRQPEAVAIEQLANAAGLSRRQLERRIGAHYGQAPVELRRTARFYHAVRRIVLMPERPALEAALDAGFYDQSQFIREFRRFTGMTPEAFRDAARGTSHFYNRRTSAQP